MRLHELSPLWLIPIAVIAGVTARSVYGNGALLLVFASCALLGAIMMFWRSLQSLTGDAPLTLEEAIGLGAPSVEEERKVAVLRALKDLEYERAVGKIDEDDFQRLSKKYRAQALQLLQVVDSELAEARRHAEQALAKHLERAGLPAAAVDETVTSNDDATGNVENDDVEDDDSEHGSPTAAATSEAAPDSDSSENSDSSESRDAKQGGEQ